MFFLDMLYSYMLLRILLAMHYLHTNWFFHQDLVIYKFSPPQKNICYFSFFYVLVFIIVLLFRFSESVNDRYNYLQYIYMCKPQAELEQIWWLSIVIKFSSSGLRSWWDQMRSKQLSCAPDELRSEVRLYTDLTFVT